MATRQRVLERDGHRCRGCGRNGALEVHHIVYRSAGRDDQPHNLVALCRGCHDAMHSDKRRYQPLLRGVIWLSYVEGRHLSVRQLERWLEKAA